MNDTCTFPGCDRPFGARTKLKLCAAHYMQRYRGQELKPITKASWAGRTAPREGDGTCVFPGCDRPFGANTKIKLCKGHYTQRWRGEELRPIKKIHGICTYPGCARPWGARSRAKLCRTHYRQNLTRERSSHSALSHCVSPDTPILTSDLRHVPASEVGIGDQLIGFDESLEGAGHGRAHRKFRTATVEAVSVVSKPGVIVRDAEGRETLCGSDHPWFIRRPNRQPRLAWVSADGLMPGSQLLSLGTWEFATSRAAGYLAGLYDGEGSLSGRGAGRKQTSLVFSQRSGAVLDAFMEAMDSLGLTYSHYKCAPNSTSPTDTVSVQGVPRILRTLGTLRPVRLINRAWEVYEGAGIVVTRQLDVTSVESLEFVREQEMVSIRTNTRTLIANGYL